MKAPLRNFVVFVLLGSLLIVGAYFLLPYLDRRQEMQTSDAGSIKGTIKIGVDNWIGYFPLCGKEVKKRVRNQGYGLKCVDDNADYASRFQSLKNGDINFAVATVDSYLLAGKAQNYPGSIVLVIDESKGGDAILSRKEAVASLAELKEKQDVTIAFTPNSPSAHLLKSVSVHFDIPYLTDNDREWAMKTDGSSGALRALKNGTAEVAVLWEPDVSRALKIPGVVKLLGTENTSKLIVDILVASRETLAAQPETIHVLLGSYFRALKAYRNAPELLHAEIREAHNLSDTEVNQMLQGVEWKNLTDNSLNWFGISQGGELGYEGLIDSIESALDIAEQSGGMKKNPLPGADPYRLLNRQFVENLYTRFSKGQFGVSAAGQSKGVTFEPLSSSQWKSLKEIGTLRVRPITFQSGTAFLDNAGKRELDKLTQNLQHYPNFRVLVRGHAGTTGDRKENQKLSQERADSVSRYLQITHDVHEHRIRSIGLGSNEPLARKSGESLRAYRYRLPRVELRLLGETF